MFQSQSQKKSISNSFYPVQVPPKVKDIHWAQLSLYPGESEVLQFLSFLHHCLKITNFPRGKGNPRNCNHLPGPQYFSGYYLAKLSVPQEDFLKYFFQLLQLFSTKCTQSVIRSIFFLKILFFQHFKEFLWKTKYTYIFAAFCFYGL